MSTNPTITEHDDDYDYQFKMVLCGAEGSGKSQLKSRLANNKFKNKSKSTVGVKFGSALFTVDKKKVRLQLLDPGGQGISAEMGRAYYRGADLLVYCADVTKETWKTDALTWFQSKEVQKAKKSGATIIFVATKNDLSAFKGNVDAMQEFARQNEMLFFLTSASSNKWGNSRETLQDGLQKGLGEALARIALGKALKKKAQEEKAQEEIIKQVVSSLSKAQNSTPINSLWGTGFGLFLLLCSGLTFLPGGPSATGTIILALGGTLLLSLGIIGLSVNKWFSKLWDKPNKKAAWVITTIALVIGLALLTAFALSFGSLPLTQLFSDKFADSVGELGIILAQVSLFVSGFFLCAGLGVCAYQRYSKSNEVQNCSDAVFSESYDSSVCWMPQATTSIPASFDPQLRQSRVGEREAVSHKLG